MKKKKIYYEPEDDVLNIWVSEKQFDFAEDDNGVIVHYTKDREPVYIEILDASRFLGKGYKSFYKSAFRSEGMVSIPHRISK